MPSAIVKGTSDLALPGSREQRRARVAADWYVARGTTPSGVVWLQHGFFRGRAHVAALAEVIAAGSGAVVVAPSISSNFVSPSGWWINGTAVHQAVARLFGDCFGELQDSVDAALGGAGAASVVLPRVFVLAGHSAGGNLATAAAGFTTQSTVDGRRDSAPVVTNLRGVVLLDAVEHRRAMASGLDRLAEQPSVPVRAVVAPDSRCNANGSGTKVLQQRRPGAFIGVRLVGGSHLDAEGEHPGRLAALTCGPPRGDNVAGLRYLATGWIRDLLSGVDTPEHLAGTTSGTVTTLPNGAVAVTL